MRLTLSLGALLGASVALAQQAVLDLTGMTATACCSDADFSRWIGGPVKSSLPNALQNNDDICQSLDGSYTSVYDATQSVTEYWYEVDLGADHDITRIRGKATSDAYTNAEIKDMRAFVCTGAGGQGCTQCGSNMRAWANEWTTSDPLKPFEGAACAERGRYIRLTKPRLSFQSHHTSFALCRLEVTGELSNTAVPITPVPAPATPPASKCTQTALHEDQDYLDAGFNIVPGSFLYKLGGKTCHGRYPLAAIYNGTPAVTKTFTTAGTAVVKVGSCQKLYDTNLTTVLLNGQVITTIPSGEVAIVSFHYDVNDVLSFGTSTGRRVSYTILDLTLCPPGEQACVSQDYPLEKKWTHLDTLWPMNYYEDMWYSGHYLLGYRTPTYNEDHQAYWVDMNWCAGARGLRGLGHPIFKQLHTKGFASGTGSIRVLDCGNGFPTTMDTAVSVGTVDKSTMDYTGTQIDTIRREIKTVSFSYNDGDYLIVDPGTKAAKVDPATLRWTALRIVSMTMCPDHGKHPSIPNDVNCVMTPWKVDQTCPTCFDGFKTVGKGGCMKAKSMGKAAAVADFDACRAACYAKSTDKLGQRNPNSQKSYRCDAFVYNSLTSTCQLFDEKRKKCKLPSRKKLKNNKAGYYSTTYRLVISQHQKKESRSIKTPASGNGTACPPDLTRNTVCFPSGTVTNPGCTKPRGDCTKLQKDSGFKLTLAKAKKTKITINMNNVSLTNAECKCAILCQERKAAAWAVETTTSNVSCTCLKNLKASKSNSIVANVNASYGSLNAKAKTFLDTLKALG